MSPLISVGAVKRHVLRRVTIAGNALPCAAVDVDLVAIHDAVIDVGYGGHQGRVVAATAADMEQKFLISLSVQAVEVRTGFAAEAVPVFHGDAGDVVIGGADPQGRVPLLAEPAGQADMVGVHMGDDDAQNGQAFQFGGEDLLPLLARLGAIDAAVDDRPALAYLAMQIGLAITQQPEVDVIEGKRQGHADPLDAGGHFQSLGRTGQGIAEWVVKSGFLA